MSENGKPKFAMYWASSCGGCEIAECRLGSSQIRGRIDTPWVLYPITVTAGFPDGNGSIEPVSVTVPAGGMDFELLRGTVESVEPLTDVDDLTQGLWSKRKRGPAERTIPVRRSRPARRWKTRIAFWSPTLMKAPSISFAL